MPPAGLFGPIGKIKEHFVDFLGDDVYERCNHELCDKQCKFEKRDLAFLLERLTGFYLYDKIVRAGLRYYEAEVLNYAQCIEANSPFRMAIIDKMRSQVRTINKI